MAKKRYIAIRTNIHSGEIEDFKVFSSEEEAQKWITEDSEATCDSEKGAAYNSDDVYLDDQGGYTVLSGADWSWEYSWQILTIEEDKPEPDAVFGGKTLFYGVVTTYSFDDSVQLRLFCNEKEAKAFLKEDFSEERRIDEEENGWKTSCDYSDDHYASITNHFEDRDDVTRWQIVSAKIALAGA